MRNVSQLHPELQKKIEQLKALCQKNGITIGISECVRTVAEQDALYAKGRTTGGSIVTNCKGTSYSSMHQWGVAFDFYLIVDVDETEKHQTMRLTTPPDCLIKLENSGRVSVLNGADRGSLLRISRIFRCRIGGALRQS